MGGKSKKSRWKQRIREAAEDALATQRHVSAADVFLRTRWLDPGHLESWRKDRLDYLFERFQGNGDKLLYTFVALRE